MPQSALSYKQQNLLINGGFDFWQRGTSFSQNNVSSYSTADRWKTRSTGSASTATFSQETSIVPTGFKYAMKIAHTAGTPAVGHSMAQRIEVPVSAGWHLVAIYFSAPGGGTADPDGDERMLTVVEL